MKTQPHAARGPRGFTLIELLTVIAIIGILAAILIPTVGRVREQSKRAKCMSNVRQISLGLVNYASTNKGQAFPSNTGTNWAWDVNVDLAKVISSQASRDVFYCPSSNMLTLYTIDQLFPYPNASSGYAVTGYVMLIPKTGQVDSVWINNVLKAEYDVTIGALSVRQPASRRPLVVDAVISTGQDFVNVSGGLTNNLSNHMAGTKPMGGHTGYVDGSVKWRPFVSGVSPVDPKVFTMKTTSGTPSFWF